MSYNDFWLRQLAAVKQGGPRTLFSKIVSGSKFIFRQIALVIGIVVTAPVVFVVVCLKPLVIIRFGTLARARKGHFTLDTGGYLCSKDTYKSGPFFLTSSASIAQYPIASIMRCGRVRCASFLVGGYGICLEDLVVSGPALTCTRFHLCEVLVSTQTGLLPPLILTSDFLLMSSGAATVCFKPWASLLELVGCASTIAIVYIWSKLSRLALGFITTSVALLYVVLRWLQGN